MVNKITIGILIMLSITLGISTYYFKQQYERRNEALNTKAYILNKFENLVNTIGVNSPYSGNLINELKIQYDIKMPNNYKSYILKPKNSGEKLKDFMGFYFKTDTSNIIIEVGLFKP